jgi:SAM-dependent MidA family methyltransferase
MSERPEIDLHLPETWPAAAREYLSRHRVTPPDPRLPGAIRDEIRASGRMTFARFMERALYHPDLGYYATAAGRIGPAGDFVTAPTTHAAFGALLARRLAALWERAGRPEPFVVAEAGAGTGALAAQILAGAGGGRTDKDPHGDTETRRATDEGDGGDGGERVNRSDHLPHPLTPSPPHSPPCPRVDPLSGGFGDALRYRIIEPYAAWREGQARALGAWAGHVSWFPELETQPGPPHVLLANELLDALPMHRVVRREDALRELYVAVDADGALVEEEGLLSTPELERYFARVGAMPPLDTTVEVNLAALMWLRRAMAATRGGWIWLLDYGAEADELYSSPRAGTLRGFQGHSLSADPFALIGAQDLTADVDFTSLMRTAEVEGWVVEDYTSQRELLLSLGLSQWLRPSARGAAPPPGGASPGRWALLQLIDPGGMGAIRSLLLRDGRARVPGCKVQDG